MNAARDVKGKFILNKKNDRKKKTQNKKLFQVHLIHLKWTLSLFQHIDFGQLHSHSACVEHMICLHVCKIHVVSLSIKWYSFNFALHQTDARFVFVVFFSLLKCVYIFFYNFT